MASYGDLPGWTPTIPVELYEAAHDTRSATVLAHHVALLQPVMLVNVTL